MKNKNNLCPTSSLTKVAIIKWIYLLATKIIYVRSVHYHSPICMEIWDEKHEISYSFPPMVQCDFMTARYGRLRISLLYLVKLTKIKYKNFKIQWFKVDNSFSYFTVTVAIIMVILITIFILLFGSFGTLIINIECLWNETFFHNFFIELDQLKSQDKDQLKSHDNFFDRIFVTALLFETFNSIWLENNTTSDIIECNYFSSNQYLTATNLFC